MRRTTKNSSKKIKFDFKDEEKRADRQSRNRKKQAANNCEERSRGKSSNNESILKSCNLSDRSKQDARLILNKKRRSQVRTQT